MRVPLRVSLRVPRKTTTMAIVSLAVLGCSESLTQPRVDPPINGLRAESVLPVSFADVAVTSSAFAGERDALEGAFTSPLADLPGGALEAEVVHVGRGCPASEFLGLPAEDPYLADPAGKIALISRATCSFVDKILRAEAAGAIAVIVYNIDEQLVRMGPEADVGVTIPGVFVQHSTGVLLRDGTAPVTARLRVVTPGESLEEAVGIISDAGLLSSGQANALLQKLANAQKQADEGNVQAATGILSALINQVQELIDSGQISAADGAILIALAQAMIDGLTA